MQFDKLLLKLNIYSISKKTLHLEDLKNVYAEEKPHDVNFKSITSYF